MKRRHSISGLIKIGVLLLTLVPVFFVAHAAAAEVWCSDSRITSNNFTGQCGHRLTSWVNNHVYYDPPSQKKPTPAHSNANSTVSSWETDCTNQYSADRNDPADFPTQRDVVNDSAYQQKVWITRQGDPTNSGSTDVIAGDSIDLQINEMMFLCGIVTMHNLGYPGTGNADFIAHKVTASQFSNDRDPVPDDASYLPNSASLYESHTKFITNPYAPGTSPTSTANANIDGTFLSSPKGQIISYLRDNNSRYWDATNGDSGLPTFTFKPDPSLTPNTDYTLIFDIDYQTIQTYHNYHGKSGSITNCFFDDAGKPNFSDPTAFYNCNDSHTAKFMWQFTVKPKWTLAASSHVKLSSSSSCGSANLQLNASQTAVFCHTIKNNGPKSANYEWRVQGMYTAVAGSAIPSDSTWAVAHDGSNNLATSGACNNPLNNPNPVSLSGVASGTTNPNYTCTYQFPAGAKPGDAYCQRLYYTHKGGPTDAASSTTAPACVTLASGPSCSLDTPSGMVEPGSRFTFTADVSYPVAPASGATITLSIPGLSYSKSVSTNGSTKDFYFYPTMGSPGSLATAPGVPQDYPASWSISTTAGSQGCGAISVRLLPYFRVFGSDVSAGGSFACTSVDPGYQGSGTIGGWYSNGTPLPGSFGASGQFGVFALGQITGFGSSEGSGPGPPTGLTFANDSNATIDNTQSSTNSANLGGSFGQEDTQATDHCLYSPTLADGDTVTQTPAPIGVAPLGDGAHEYDPGDVELSGGTVPVTTPGTNIAVHVQGNAYISGNITYGSGWNSSNVPSFILVADGDIYINSNVTNLDGIYVARDGNIYTCASAPNTPVTQNGLYGICNKQLIVHGSFVANKVNLLRVPGSLRDAVNDTDPRGASHACTYGGSLPVCAGEVFDFSLEMYLNSGWQIENGDDSSLKYDAITALPPVL